MKPRYLITIALILTLIGLMAYRAYASSVGPNYGSIAANVAINGQPTGGGGGGDAWVNINNSKVLDGVFANGSVCASCDGVTELDQITGFGFSIPSNATINGIQVSVTRKYIDNGFTPQCTPLPTDWLLYLDYSNATSSTNKADTVTPWTSTATTITYGSSSDLWGGTWTPAKINDSTFGVAFSATECYAGLPQVNPGLDAISITVYYTTSSGTPQVQIRSGQINIKSGNLILK